jgi:hypothetical protein
MKWNMVLVLTFLIGSQALAVRVYDNHSNVPSLYEEMNERSERPIAEDSRKEVVSSQYCELSFESVGGFIFSMFGYSGKSVAETFSGPGALGKCETFKSENKKYSHYKCRCSSF